MKISSYAWKTQPRLPEMNRDLVPRLRMKDRKIRGLLRDESSFRPITGSILWIFQTFSKNEQGLELGFDGLTRPGQIHFVLCLCFCVDRLSLPFFVFIIMNIQKRKKRKKRKHHHSNYFFTSFFSLWYDWPTAVFRFTSDSCYRICHSSLKQTCLYIFSDFRSEAYAWRARSHDEGIWQGRWRDCQLCRVSAHVFPDWFWNPEQGPAEVPTNRWYRIHQYHVQHTRWRLYFGD